MATVQPKTIDENSVISRLLQHCHRRHYAAKQTIVRQGDAAQDLYYIVKGSVTVTLEDEGGHDLILTYLNRGEFFGEMGWVNESEERSAMVRAKTACEIAHISYERLKSLTTIGPELLAEIASQLALRLRKTNARLGDLAFMDVAGRVSHALLDLCKQPDAMTHPEGMQIHVTRTELARLVCCTREMVGRVLTGLEAQGMIAAYGKTVVVYRERAKPIAFAQTKPSIAVAAAR